MGLVAALVLSLLAYIRERRQWRIKMQAKKQLPPGPRPWPVVGNILQLGFSPYKSFTRLARKHGPIMTIRLGSKTTVVVSSPSTAREMFKSHDASLAGRMLYESMKLSSGSEGSMITAQLGAHWRMMGRLCNTGFFTTSRLNAMQNVRRQCVDSLVDRVSSHRDRPVDIGRLLFLMTFDHMGRSMLSKELLGTESKVCGEFFYHAGRIMELAGKPNVADFMLVLLGLDLQWIRRRMDLHVGRALQIVPGFVDERIEREHDDKDGGCDGECVKKFLDLLLEFKGDGVEEPTSLSRKTINNFLFEMFIAGTETTASTMEWVMAELIRHPAAMCKVQAELRKDTSKYLEGKDLVNLPYLNGVIKETMRLHPPLPFLVPHKAMKPCTVLGYHIPQGTQILVNVWGIARDRDSWDEPGAFRPERFMSTASAVDYNGQHYEYIPFGSGRRICPAIKLMSRMLPMVIGTLLRSFDWVLPEGAAIDMRERLGITLKKAAPLRVIATPYREREGH